MTELEMLRDDRDELRKALDKIRDLINEQWEPMDIIEFAQQSIFESECRERQMLLTVS